MFFTESYNLYTEPLLLLGVTPPKPSPKMKMNTMIFFTFVLMNLFNQINCRVINPSEKNVFKTLFNNNYFLMIFSFEMALTVYIIYLPEGSII